MISFSQNCEDVLLQRAFAAQAHGTWVDVGASHPVDDSVTKALSLRGWTGINIEPLQHMHELLVVDRPHDVNLQVALSSRPGQLDYYRGLGGLSGLSTLDKEVAEGHIAKGYPFEVVSLPVTTLDEVFAQHVNARVDFLKVDVEGHELSVLQGVDLARHAPRVVVVEATEPSSPQQNHHEWEPLVLRAGYVLTLFDGLNRFYVHQTCPELMEALSVPANVFDGYVTYRSLAERQALEEAAEASAEAATNSANTAAELQRHARAVADTANRLLAERVQWPATYPLDTLAQRRVLFAPHRSTATTAQALAFAQAASVDTTLVVWLPETDSGKWTTELEDAVRVAGASGDDADLLLVLEADENVTAGRLAAAATHVLAPVGPLAAYVELVPGASCVTIEELRRVSDQPPLPVA